MEHDGTQDGNTCNHDNYVMSPTLGAGKTSWSSCSRDYLDKFVRSSQANCILGTSRHINIINQFISEDKLPGQTFTADQQCALRFGADARHSSLQPLEDICRLVRCDTGTGRNAIAFHAHPALEGTTCGHKRVLFIIAVNAVVNCYRFFNNVLVVSRGPLCTTRAANSYIDVSVNTRIGNTDQSNRRRMD